MPRQNGKGVVLEVVTLAKAVLLGERVLWTAHEVRTMQESFMRFRAILDATPALAALVESVRTANGQERIVFRNGAEVKFSARSKSATRGLGFRTIICDEAQELDYLALGAMVPTMSGQGDERTQLILTGTPPYSRMGEVFSDLRAAAHTSGDDRACWVEWSAALDDRLDDRDVWRKTNPSLGIVIREDKVEDELATLQARPDVFRRERLGEWGQSGDSALALDQARWADGGVQTLPERDPRYTYSSGDARFLAVDCTFSAEWTTLVEVVPVENERVGIRVLWAEPGLTWVADKVAEVMFTTRRVSVAFDPLRTGDLTADLRDVGLRNRIHAASSRELTLGCDALVRAVREGRVVHADPRLDAAAMGATRSTFDDGRGWKLVGVKGADVSPLIAAALALRVLQDQRPRRQDADERRAVVL